jgi:hypothetical protein
MLSVRFDDGQFARDMNNIIKYSVGFMEGAQAGKTQLFHAIAAETIELLKQYIDSNARANPRVLHHIYEWYETGSPNARLFDIDYTVSNLGLSFRSTFSQSTSVSNGSSSPFYDKARIMEEGIPVTIRPKRSEVLVFEDDNGETIYTRKPVTVDKPGGETEGEFERVFDQFFMSYFTQAFLRSSGIMEFIQNPIAFKKNFKAGKRGGKSTGYQTGYRWIANAGMSR